MPELGSARLADGATASVDIADLDTAVGRGPVTHARASGHGVAGEMADESAQGLDLLVRVDTPSIGVITIGQLVGEAPECRS